MKKPRPKRKSVKKHVFVQPQIMPDSSNVLKKIDAWWKKL